MMTPGAMRVLKELAADDRRDLVEEDGMVYCGYRRTSSRVVRELLCLMAVSVACNTNGFITYAINETGRSLIRRPELEAELKAAMAKRAAISVINDRIVEI
jgi:hypothetical protein